MIEAGLSNEETSAGVFISAGGNEHNNSKGGPFSVIAGHGSEGGDITLNAGRAMGAGAGGSVVVRAGDAKFSAGGAVDIQSGSSEAQQTGHIYQFQLQLHHRSQATCIQEICP